MTHSATNNFDLRTLWNLLIVKKQRRVWACNRTRKKIAIFVKTVAVKRGYVSLLRYSEWSVMPVLPWSHR